MRFTLLPAIPLLIHSPSFYHIAILSLVLSPFAFFFFMPYTAGLLMFAYISKFMIFLFPYIWLFFPATSCYCDALDLNFFLSALFYSSYHFLIISSLFFYPSHHNTNCVHSIFTGVLQPFIFVVFSYILREYSPLDRRLLRHLCSADQHWQLLNCSDMEIW